MNRSANNRSLDPFGLRALIISWCLWLLISWSITLSIGATAHAVRWIVFSAVFGLMAVWPTVRLSQQLTGRCADTATGLSESVGGIACVGVTPSARVMATMLDWVCLLGVFQVVVWPLMLVGRWSVQQTMWLDLAVSSWSLLTALLVGLGRVVPMTWARVGAMLGCMLLLVGEPAWMAIVGVGFDSAQVGARAGQAAWQMRISPLQALWELTTTVRPYDPLVWRATILSTTAASVLGWVVLWEMVWWAGPSPGVVGGLTEITPSGGGIRASFIPRPESVRMI